MDLYKDRISQSLASSKRSRGSFCFLGIDDHLLRGSAQGDNNPAHALVVRGLQQGSSEVGYPYRLLLVFPCAQKYTWLYWVKDARGD